MVVCGQDHEECFCPTPPDPDFSLLLVSSPHAGSYGRTSGINQLEDDDRSAERGGTCLRCRCSIAVSNSRLAAPRQWTRPAWKCMHVLDAGEAEGACITATVTGRRAVCRNFEIVTKGIG